MANLGEITKGGIAQKKLYLFNPEIKFEAVVVGGETWITASKKHCAATSGKLLIQTSVTGTAQFLPESTYERINDYQIKVKVESPPCQEFSGYLQFPYYSNNTYKVDIASLAWASTYSGSNASTIQGSGLIEIKEPVDLKKESRITVLDDFSETPILGFETRKISDGYCPVEITKIFTNGSSLQTKKNSYYFIEELLFDDSSLATQNSRYEDNIFYIDTDNLAAGIYGFQIYEVEPQKETLRLSGEFNLV